MYRVFTPQFDQTLTLANLWEGQPEDKMANLRAQMLDKADAIMPELPPLPAHDAPLTLLLDLSGSMRGYKIFHSIVSLIAVGRLLSAAGQTFQVLGFTTKSWKGGQARQAWLDGDKHPPSPGRLTVLRHIVIKDFDTDWSQMEPLIQTCLNMASHIHSCSWASSGPFARRQSRPASTQVREHPPRVCR